MCIKQREDVNRRIAIEKSGSLAINAFGATVALVAVLSFVDLELAEDLVLLPLVALGSVWAGFFLWKVFEMPSEDSGISNEDEFRAVIQDGVLYRVEVDDYGDDPYFVRVGEVVEDAE